MKLINPKPKKVKVVARHEKGKDQHRIEVKQLHPSPDNEGRTVWTFTVYDTDLNEVKDLLVKAFERATGESFPVDQKRELSVKK